MRVRLVLVIVTGMSTVKQSCTEMQEACKTIAISPKCSRPCCCGLRQSSQQLRTVKTVNFCRRDSDDLDAVGTWAVTNV